MNIDFSNWHKRWSTWLAAASVSASAALGAFALFPTRVQGLMPDWLLLITGAVAFGAAALVPLATSVGQKNLTKKPGTPPANS